MTIRPCSHIFWGWYVVFGAFIIMGINHGTSYCFSIFVKPISSTLHWSRSVVSIAPSIMMLTYGIGGIFSGRLLDRLAPRWILTFGAVMLSTGLFLTSFVQSPWQLYLSYGVLCGIGSSCFGVVVCSSYIGKWFMRKRGLAIGIATMGIGIASMILAPSVGYIVKNYGWRSGFWFLGTIIITLGISISQGFMRKTKPEDYGLLPDNEVVKSTEGFAAHAAESLTGSASLKTVFRDSRFWLLTLCYSLVIMAQMSAFVHQVAYAIDCQIEVVTAALTPGYIGIASIGGRFFFGWLSDCLRDAKYAAALAFVFMAAGVIILMNVTSPRSLFFYAVLFGFGYGSFAPMMPYLLADRFGRHVLGGAYGMLTFFAAGIGGGSGAILSGFIFDYFGSYRNAWLVDLVVLMLATLLILTVKPGNRASAS